MAPFSPFLSAFQGLVTIFGLYVGEMAELLQLRPTTPLEILGSYPQI